jgi:hypothetical protein
MVKNAAHVACAALNEVRHEHVRQRVPPNGTFEVCTMSICMGMKGYTTSTPCTGVQQCLLNNCAPDGGPRNGDMGL